MTDHRMIRIERLEVGPDTVRWVFVPDRCYCEVCDRTRASFRGFPPPQEIEPVELKRRCALLGMDTGGEG